MMEKYDTSFLKMKQALTIILCMNRIYCRGNYYFLVANKTRHYLESRNFSFAAVPLVVQILFNEMVMMVMDELRREPIRMSGRRRRVAVQRDERHCAAVLNARHVVALLHQLRF